MKNIHQVHQVSSSKSEKKEKVDKAQSEMQKKEKLLSVGVYALIIIMTVALMLILFNLIIKS
jgi:cytoskeletal protein RodZ